MSVTQVFSGDDKDLVRAYQNLARENLKLREESSKTAQASRQHHEESQNFLKEQVAGVGRAIVGLYSLEKAIELGTDAYREMREEVAKLAEEEKRRNEQQARVVGSAGDIGRSEDLRRLGLAGQYYKQEEFTAAFGSVSNQARNASFERRAQLARVAAEASPLVEPGQFGQVVGALGEFMPQKGAKEIGDLGLKLTQMAGQRSGELTSETFLRTLGTFKGAGLGEEQIFATAITALQQHESPKLLEKIADVLEHPPEVKVQKPRPGHRPEPLSEEDELKKKFAEAGSAQQRLELLMTDEKLQNAVLGDQASKWRQMSSTAQTQANLEALRGSKGLLDRSLLAGETGGGPLGADIRRRRAEADKARAQAADAVEAQAEATSDTQFEATIAEQGWASRWISRGGRRLQKLYRSGAMPGSSAESDSNQSLGIDERAMRDAENLRRLNPQAFAEDFDRRALEQNELATHEKLSPEEALGKVQRGPQRQGGDVASAIQQLRGDVNRQTALLGHGMTGTGGINDHSE